MNYEPTIGLEVHAQLSTKTKIFCGCSTTFGSVPNSQTCPVCSGLPGVLPVLNKEVVRYAIRFALTVGADIQEKSQFHRKNYFYPDLPKGYQISQYDQPLACGGKIKIEVDGRKKEIELTRIHLEEDAGKLTHSSKGSLIDLNRCGVPLIEIVSTAQIDSPKEAYQYLIVLKSILLYTKVCNCDMEKGSLRCDANISVKPMGSLSLGTKVELKNMNSFKAIQHALNYEIRRQIEICEGVGKIYQETRLWDEEREITIPMRSKEEAHDYRYFPEPDLLPIVIYEDWLKDISMEVPELPSTRKDRFIRDYNLPVYDAEVLTSSRELADFYEAAVRNYQQPKPISNWIMTELLAKLAEGEIDIDLSPVKPVHLAQIVKLIDEGVISGKIAKEVFSETFATGLSPIDIVHKKGLVQISDEESIKKIVAEVILENPEAIEDYRNGKEQALSFLVGQVMKKTRGKANPQIVNNLLCKWR